MAIAGHTICAGLGGFAGNVGGGEIGDWCDFPAGWSVFQSTALEIDVSGHCTCWGGQLIWTPVDTGYTSEGWRSDARFDLTGADLWWRMRLPQGSSPFGFVTFLDGEPDTGVDNRTWIRFEPAATRLDLFIQGDTVDEYIRITGYEPDGAHAWMRMVHDADTDLLELQTAPYCGNWTTRLSATMDSPMSDLHIEILQEVDTGTAPGWMSTIHVAPDEDPES